MGLSDMDAQCSKTYEPFRPRHAIQLAAPHTWAASVMPVLLGCAFAYHEQGFLDASLALILLVICVLMQSSVNTFNDYFDFIKGTDTEQDALEADDSTLVNDKLKPSSALRWAVLLLGVAFALGLYVIWRCGFIPLWIALIGAVAVVLYSAGKTPISYLPIGEAVSGIVMGGLIPLACTYCLTHHLSAFPLLWSIPSILGVGLIMMTNNTCDIEKDLSAGRRTLPGLLERRRTKKAYQALMICWLGAICILVGACFSQGAIILPFMVLASLGIEKALWNNPLTQQGRIAAMGAITSLNVVLGGFYALCIVL